MKNKLLRYLLGLIFIIQGTTLTSQTALDQLYLGLRIGPGTFSRPYIYIPGHDNFISIRKKSDFKFSINISRAWKNSNGSYSRDNYDKYSRWNGKISNFTLGYSPVPNLYATANFLFENQRSSFWYDSQTVLGGIGIGGYFLKESIDEKPSEYNMPDQGLLINGLIGYTRGNISHDGINRFGFGKFILNQFYGKIGVDYQARYWGIASNIRVGVLNYGTTQILGRAFDDLGLHRELLTTQNDFLFGELSVRTYLGIKYGQFYINGVITRVNDELRRFILPDMLTVGIVLDIQEIFKKKEKK